MLYRRLLFYYSIIISTSLFLWIIFSVPKPEGFIFLLLFLPIPFHFWITITGLRKTKPKVDSSNTDTQQAPPKPKTHVRFGFFVLVMIAINTLSIFTYSLMSERQFLAEKNPDEAIDELSDTDKKLEKIIYSLEDLGYTNEYSLEQLDKIYAEIIENEPVVLGTTSELESILDEDKVATKKVIRSIAPYPLDVYERNSSSSKIVGEAEFDESYPYIKKEGNWYQITLSDSTVGWVMAQFVEEVLQ